MDTTIYIEPEALTQWNTDMSAINTAALDELENFLTNVKSLEESWAGDSATGFLEDNDEFLTTVKSHHEEMKDVSQLLITVVETMSKV